MPALYEQYGLYLTGLGGSAYMARCFTRSYYLAQYVTYKGQPALHEEAKWAAAMAWAAPHELEHAGLMAARLRFRGVGVALGAPMLWVAFRLLQKQESTLTQ